MLCAQKMNNISSKIQAQHGKTAERPDTSSSYIASMIILTLFIIFEVL